MSRRHSAEKREIIPDAKFGDIVVTKFMNSIMYDGKKSAAEGIVYGAFDIIEGRAKTSAQTGVEMEALTAVAVAALTVYDMVKAVDKGMVIGDIRLMKKTGGKSGTYVRR